VRYRDVTQDLRQLVRAELAGSTGTVRQRSQSDARFLVTRGASHQAPLRKET
jgi:hypothetical protein